MRHLKRTKKMLISSVLSFVLCLSMLIGSTLAWFTDSISAVADINVGTLNIALEKYIDGAYKNIGTKDGNTAYTEDADGVFSGTDWSPNQTEVYYLAVRNEEDPSYAYSLAFKYDMAITMAGELLSGDPGALEYAIIDGVEAGSEAADEISAAADQNNWDKIKNITGVQTDYAAAGVLQAAPNGYLEPGEADYFALVLHMRADAGNEYQGKTFNADIVVNAYQTTYVAPEPVVPDPFADYTVALKYDFEDNFAFGNYAATTGVGAYAPNGSISVDAEGENHFGRMTRIWTASSRPSSLSGIAAPRMQFNELTAAVDGKNSFVLSFDIKQFVNDSFVSFSIPGLKLNNDRITVCFKEGDTPVALVDLSDDEWHNVAAVFNRTTGTIQYYGDHVLLEGVEGTFTGTGFSADGYLRFQMDAYGYPKLTEANQIGDVDFFLKIV